MLAPGFGHYNKEEGEEEEGKGEEGDSRRHKVVRKQGGKEWIWKELGED